MVIVGINGGLGNQMFQYALYLKLKALGKEVYIDDEILVSKLNNTKAQKIFDVFDLEYQICDKRTVIKFADVSMDPLSRVRRKLFGAKNRQNTLYKEILDGHCHNDVFSLENMYISGCWQSEKYFSDISDIIVENFAFKIPQEEVNEVLAEIENTNSVSIHLRRGDYVGNSIYDNICNDDYYNRAIKYIKKHVDKPRFFIFSDDPQYAKEKYQGEEYIVVDSFCGNRSHYDMYLMTKCKYNVVANSSFSWWGAWLGQSEDKIVICPEKWANGDGSQHTPCETWVKM